MEDYIREETKRLRRENIERVRLERVRLAKKENIREMSLSIESKDKK